MKKSTTLQNIVIALVFMIASTVSFAADLTASTNTKNVIEGNPFQLVLSTTTGENMPDLEPLYKDFEILGKANQSSIQIINGRRSQSSSLVLTLLPKKTGEITIPALTSDHTSTRPIKIKVVDSANAPKSQGAGDSVHLSATLSDAKSDVYSFQEVPITVRIETSQIIRQVALIPPSGDFTLRQNGEDRVLNTAQNTVIERDYLLRPNKPGALTIPPFVLKGHLSSPTRRDPFSSFGRNGHDFDAFFSSPFGRSRPVKPFYTRSEPIELNVLKNPNATSGEWFLPAKSVEIKDQWLPQNPNFKQGEAATRIVYLVALGARAEQLPKLKIDNPDGAKIYVDNDQIETRQVAHGSEAVRKVTLSIVPTRGGKVTLPAISVKWLNTETNTNEVATLPAQTIGVIGDIIPKAQPTTSAQTTPPTQKDSPKKVTPPKTKTFSGWQSRQTLWYSLGALVLIAIVASVVVVKRRQRRLGNVHLSSDNDVTATKQATPQQQKNRTAEIRQNIETAVKSNHWQALYQALLAWKQHHKAIDPELVAVMNKIEQTLYQPQAEGDAPAPALDMNSMAKTIRQFTKQAPNPCENEVIPPLYKSHQDK